jgi:hypothetical protein
MGNASNLSRRAAGGGRSLHGLSRLVPRRRAKRFDFGAALNNRKNPLDDIACVSLGAERGP